MKRFFKKRLLLFMIVFMTIFCTQFQLAAAYDDARTFIRIGLYFSDPSKGVNNAVFSVEIGSGNGMEIVHIGQNNQVVLAEYQANRNVTVRKDSWYVRDGSRYIEYSPDRVPSSGDKGGPYHIKVSPVYSNRESAEKAAASLKDKGIDAYLVFDGRWCVWSGYYPDSDSAQKAMAEIEKYTGEHECEVVNNAGKGIAVVDEKGDTLVMYVQNAGVLGFVPKEKEGTVPLINVNGKPYRGRAEVYRQDGSDMTVVNEVWLEEYLYGVVPCEISASAHPEALKAQAVAARTYAVRNKGKYKSLGFNLCDTALSQVYKGYSVEHPNTNRAVDETNAEIVTYNGSPAATYYFSSSGGMTESITNVWGGPEIPYLVSVEDKYEKGDTPNYNWEVSYTASQIRNELKARSRDLGEITSIKISRYSDAGRVVELSITGTKGEETLTNANCRSFLDSLCSQMYTISTEADTVIMGSSGETVVSPMYGKEIVTSSGTKQMTGKTISIVGAGGVVRTIPAVPTSYTFRGKGWGHAVGMSQAGARGMAEAGFSYREILGHYYPGTVVE